MQRDAFEQLEPSAVAELLRDRGVTTCVFYLNGTRRWFLLEHADPERRIFDEQHSRRYVEALRDRMLEIYRLLYDFGFTRILSPGIAAPNLERGDGYIDSLFAPLLRSFAESPQVHEFLETYDVSVYFYGEVDDYLPSRASNDLELVRSLSADARADSVREFFMGLCAVDHATAAASVSAQFLSRHGRTPTRDEIIANYYGRHIDRIHVAMAYGRFSLHSTPFFSFGEDLYFLTSPSMYFNERTLRNILYDKLFSRRIDDRDYDDLSTESFEAISSHYRRNAGNAFGIGAQDASGMLWHPLPGTTFDETEAAALVADPVLRGWARS